MATGLLGALAMAPWAPPEIGVVAFVPLFATLVAATTVRSAFAQGFLANFVMVGLSRSFVVDAATLYFGSVGPGVLTLFGVAGLHGLVFGAVCAVSRVVWSRVRATRGQPMMLGLAAVFATLAEMFVPLPLPYPAGMSLGAVDGLARGVSVFGVCGLSAACYASSASVVALLRRDGRRNDVWSGPAVLIVMALAGPAADVFGGDARPRSEAPVTLTIQGGARGRSEPPTFAAPNGGLTILPESVFPATLAAEDVAALADRLAGEEHGPLLFATNVTVEGHAKNRAFLIAADGKVLGVADKRILIPLAEGPLRALFVRDEAQRDVLSVEGTRITTTICYESLFPWEVRERVREHDARLHVNLANDGWFVDVRPHEAQVRALRLRAIENGVTTIRVSNQGTSIVFLPDGSTLWRGNPGEMQTLTVPIEPARTLFSRLGSIPILLLLVAMTIGVWWRFRAASCTPS